MCLEIEPWICRYPIIIRSIYCLMMSVCFLDNVHCLFNVLEIRTISQVAQYASYSHLFPFVYPSVSNDLI
jgi:hypothetical protein